MSSSLVIQDLHVAIGEKEIVKGVSLTVNTGEVHAIMGPNGTGKSTLAKSHPSYARWAWLAVVIAIAFWLLDAHLLRQRGLYRKVHARARIQTDAAIDFSLDTSAVDSEADAWTSLMFSHTLVVFYGGVLAAIAALRLFQ